MQFTRSKCLVCKMLVDKGKKFQHYAHQHMKEEEVPFLCKCGGRFNSLSALRQHFKRNHKGKPDEKNYRNPKERPGRIVKNLEMKFSEAKELKVQAGPPKVCETKYCSMGAHYNNHHPCKSSGKG